MSGENYSDSWASAFFCSPFDKAAVLVVDGMGEWPTTSLYQGLGNQLHSVATVNFPHSLGFFYSAFTEYFGFDPFDGEYKVMGMAPYGTPTGWGYFFLLVDPSLFRPLAELKRDGGAIIHALKNIKGKVVQVLSD